MKKLAILALAAVAGAAAAQSPLAGAATANNGSGGIFLQLTGINSVTITHFETFVTTGTANASIQVWTRPGAYAGFTASNAGWILHDTVTIGATSSATLATVDPLDFNVGASQTVSVYLHSITTGRGIRYNGTTAAPPTINYGNADLQMLTDISRTGAVAFGGTQFTPRAFAGNVHYTIVPEPASMAALSAGVLLLLRRRRK